MLEKGDNFEVKCEGNGKPTPTVTWRKSSGTVASNVELTNGILKIKAATLENSGIYECETQSKAGKDIARILIIVQNSKVAPKVKVEPNSLLLIEGKSARVKCTVLEGNPTPTLIWSRERNHRFEEYQQGELLE